jgi:hypothetical protein
LTVIYAKTQKGLTEMESRSGEIGPRVRRLLIFVDGKRSVDQLKAMVGRHRSKKVWNCCSLAGSLRWSSPLLGLERSPPYCPP